MKEVHIRTSAVERRSRHPSLHGVMPRLPAKSAIPVLWLPPIPCRDCEQSLSILQGDDLLSETSPHDLCMKLRNKAAVDLLDPQAAAHQTYLYRLSIPVCRARECHSWPLIDQLCQSEMVSISFEAIALSM